MERNAALKLADEILVATAPNVPFGLRAALSESFELMEAPQTRLVQANQERRKAFLLSAHGLVIVDVQTDPPSAAFRWVDLSDASLTREIHTIEEKQSGAWWTTTWLLHASGGVVESLVGSEGPQRADEVELFARAVAKATGWPIEAPARSS
jgi:hypothetical protein